MAPARLPYPDGIRRRAGVLLLLDLPMKTVEQVTRVGERTLFRWKANLKLYRCLERPAHTRPPRARQLTLEMQHFLKLYLDENPHAMLVELVQIVEELYKVKVHTTTIGKALAASGLRRGSGSKRRAARRALARQGTAT